MVHSLASSQDCAQQQAPQPLPSALDAEAIYRH